MEDFELKGKVDVSLYGITIPSSLLAGDDGVVTNAEEKTIEINSMDGVMTVGTRIFDNVNVAFTVILPNMDYLKNIMPDLYEAGTGGQTVGRVAIGGTTCSVSENTPLVVHYTCQENSDNDIYVPNANVIATFELNQNSDDPVTVQFTANALPSLEEGHNGVKMFLGTGDLTEKTLWNAATEAYEPLAS
jgi:hypothetical protein